MQSLFVRAASCRALALAWPLGLAALAAPAAALTRPDPLDTTAKVPAVTAPSALRQYRPLRDTPALPWREANAAVEAAGGWRAYAREIQAGGAPSPAPAGSPTSGSAAHGAQGAHAKP